MTQDSLDLTPDETFPTPAPKSASDTDAKLSSRPAPRMKASHAAPRSAPQSISPRVAPKKDGYYARTDRRAEAGGKKVEPGSSFISIPKFKNKRSFPFVTPQMALKSFLGYEELKPTPTPKDVLRIIPLGGVEQVGLNCTAFEYNGEVLIIDM